MSFKTSTIEVVKESDINAYIEEVFGYPYCLQQEQFWGNDTLQYWEVFADPEATARVEEWLSRKHQDNYKEQHGFAMPGRVEYEGAYYGADIINELCNRGLIPERDLNIHVYW